MSLKKNSSLFSQQNWKNGWPDRKPIKDTDLERNSIYDSTPLNSADFGLLVIQYWWFSYLPPCFTSGDFF